MSGREHAIYILMCGATGCYDVSAKMRPTTLSSAHQAFKIHRQYDFTISRDQTVDRPLHATFVFYQHKRCLAQYSTQPC
ncbi:hypothetical protein J1614_002572 [Plenodomus biglobosus]|nr:hypothetical protein J1614_002572 [Plenodomus biglobosus]